MNSDQLMLFSNLIQLLTLGVVIIYTCVTYKIFRQQNEQFTKSLRPWVSGGDILYNERLILPEFGILIHNIGKLPAMCSVQIMNLSIKHPFAENEETIILKDEAKEFIVFPFAGETDAGHIFFVYLSEEQSLLFVHGAKIQCDLRIHYTIIGDIKQKRPFEYSSNLLVERFNTETNKQETLIRVKVAT